MFVLLIIFFFCHFNGTDSAVEYYVIPSNGEKSKCPPGAAECHPLSHYTNQPVQNFLDVTFIFLEGKHVSESTLQFTNGNEVKLLRLQSTSHQEQHSSSSVTIRCTNTSFSAFDALYVNKFHAKGLTITNCGAGFWMGSSFSSINTIKFEELTILYCNMGIWTGSGVASNILIAQSTFNFLNTSGVYIKGSKSAIVLNSSFRNSSFSVSGGIVKIANSTFDNTETFIHLLCQSCNKYLVITNSVFYGFRKYKKNALGVNIGALDISCDQFINSIVYLSNTTVINNSITGIAVGGCSVIFAVQPSLIANNHSPYNGGGMWLDGQSTISSDGNTSISFINNTSEGYGGAIFIEMHWDAEFAITIHSCSISKLNPVFINNLALRAGDNVYGGLYFGCESDGSYGVNVSSSITKLLNCNSLNILKYFPRPLSSYISTEPLIVCLCTENTTIDCSKRTLHKEIYPGQDISLSLVTVGQCGGISPSGLEVTTDSNGIDIAYFNNQQTGNVCKQFNYGIKLSITSAKTHSNSGQLIISLGENEITNYIQLPLLVNVTFSLCPLGLSLQRSNGICDCNDILSAVGEVKCNISNASYPISRFENIWLYYSHQDNCTVAYKNCPFDYCNTSTVHLNLNQSDMQCMHNRSGILCGQCQEGQSIMLGSNQCGQCSNYYLFMLPVFIVAGICMMSVLLALNLTISVGTINGLLFYANVLKLNQPVIFPNGNIPALTQFIAWLNLDFGFNVCLYDGLDGYWKTWLQFAFSLILISFIILCCKFSGRLSRLFGNNVVSVLSTLIFMAHSKILLNVRNVLTVSPLKCDEMQWKFVWSVDGNIEYLSGKHIPLFVVSLIFLLIGLMYTVMILCSQWLQRYGGKYCRSSLDLYVRLKPFIDAHTGPYKDKYRFWTGLLLIIRLILTGIFPYTAGILPQVNNFITATISFFLLGFVRGKYNQMHNTALEMFYLSNLFITSLLNAVCYSFRLDIVQYVNGASVGLSLVVFKGILLVHVVKLIKKKCPKRVKQPSNIIKISEEMQEPDNHKNDYDSPEYSPARILNRRESLIFDFVPTTD